MADVREGVGSYSSLTVLMPSDLRDRIVAFSKDHKIPQRQIVLLAIEEWLRNANKSEPV